MMRWSVKTWLAIFSLIFVGPICAAQDGMQQVRLPEFGIEFQIPEYFELDAELAATDETVSHMYFADTTGDGYYDTELSVRPTGKRLDQVLLSRSMLPPGSDHIELLRRHWNGLVINATRIPEDIDGVAYVNFNVVYPTIPEGVIIGVAGPAESEEAVFQLSKSIADSFVGQTNWVPGGTTPAQAPPSDVGVSKQGGELRLQLMISAAVGGVVLTGLIYSFWWRKFPRGVFFILSVVTFSLGRVGLSEAPDQSFLFLLTKAVFMTMGLTGFVFGFLDIFRSRKPKTPKNNRKPVNAGPPAQTTD